ncbi:MAG: fumarylacetoacetate hydrolase family protein [Cocleimonas sp.]|nr:fumarylacetoacetate hydrolase family protein [Cocleimonas sp.]
MNTINLNHNPLTPSKIICIGRNFVEHIRELNNEIPTEPVIFFKPNSAISDDLIAGDTEPHHFEGEICFLIKNQRLYGVGLGLDITKRQLQSTLKAKGLPWERAKAFDGAAVFSPFIILETPITQLRMVLYHNHISTQTATYDLMIYKPNVILKEIQQFSTLETGDIIMTGTPKGVGIYLKGDHFKVQLYDQQNLLIEHTWQVI